MNIVQKLEAIEPEIKKDLASIQTLESLEEVRVKYLGRKGLLAGLMAEIPSLPPDRKPEAGKTANRIKENCVRLLAERKQELEKALGKGQQEHFDYSMPGRHFWQGSLHPVTLVMEELCAVFRKMGYDIVAGPEIEVDWYNFEALNMPPDHPARDMQDTLYITDNVLLRTHTSPVQIRTMLSRKAPLAIVAPGKVYRRDSDLTHTPMFHQIEGLYVGENISMADLRGTLSMLIIAIFGENTGMRFRPSFFPFTEPSAEVDITCAICNGSGVADDAPCRVCKGSGWVEILGCGMVDPAVFASVKYPADLSGFAFGLGLERIAMLKYGIDDLRLFFQNDIRFLSQFGQMA